MTPLVDTNVLLDVFLKRQPHFPASSSVWALAERRAYRFLVSAVSFNNAFYILRKTEGPTNARECVGKVTKVFEIAPVDASVIGRAIASPLADFEDAMQAESALAAGADVIVTRNPKDFASAGLLVLSPADFLTKALTNRQRP